LEINVKCLKTDEDRVRRIGMRSRLESKINTRLISDTPAPDATQPVESYEMPRERNADNIEIY
jgi:hypothetical protein